MGIRIYRNMVEYGRPNPPETEAGRLEKWNSLEEAANSGSHKVEVCEGVQNPGLVQATVKCQA